MSIDRLIEFAGNHPFLIATLAAIIMFIVVSEMRRQSASRAITPREAVRLINDQDAIVLDVREPNEYKTGHILNAKNIPLSRLDEDAPRLSKKKDTPVIIYCKSGASSQAACTKLLALGYTQAFFLKSGLYSWQEESLPMAK